MKMRKANNPVTGSRRNLKHYAFCRIKFPRFKFKIAGSRNENYKQIKFDVDNKHRKLSLD